MRAEALHISSAGSLAAGWTINHFWLAAPVLGPVCLSSAGAFSSLFCVDTPGLSHLTVWVLFGPFCETNYNLTVLLQCEESAVVLAEWIKTLVWICRDVKNPASSFFFFFFKQFYLSSTGLILTMLACYASYTPMKNPKEWRRQGGNLTRVHAPDKQYRPYCHINHKNMQRMSASQ